MRARMAFAILLAVAVAGCSSREKEIQRILDSPIEYEAHVSPWANFNDFVTWDWMPVENNVARVADPQLRQAIEQSIATQMHVRDYEKTVGAPDLVVNYQVTARLVNTDYIQRMYDGEYLPEYRVDFNGPGSAKKRWDEGSLIIVIFDRASRELVWRGVAKAEIARDAPIDQSVARVGKAIKQMFTSLPGRPRFETGRGSTP